MHFSDGNITTSDWSFIDHLRYRYYNYYADICGIRPCYTCLEGLGEDCFQSSHTMAPDIILIELLQYLTQPCVEDVALLIATRVVWI